MSDSRDLNYKALDMMLECGFSEKDILESLIKASDASTINDIFAYIFRVHDFIEDNEDALKIYNELKQYEKEAAN